MGSIPIGFFLQNVVKFNVSYRTYVFLIGHDKGGAPKFVYVVLGSMGLGMVKIGVL